MNKLIVRVNSANPYYQYIKNYSPAFLRKYQSDMYFKLGRRGRFDTLQYKMAGDHMSLEEEHCLKYKTPTFIMNFSYRFSIVLMIYILFYCNCLLGFPERIFNMHDFDYRTQPTSEGDNFPRYESMYVIYHPPKY